MRYAPVLVILVAAPAAAAPPTVFAPDVISGPTSDSAPAFTPDGKTVYFGRGNPAGQVIMTSERHGDTWSAPAIAPFSGEWSDMEPAMAPDGSYLVFASNRPAKPGEPPLDGAWNGKTFYAGGGNLWRVDLPSATPCVAARSGKAGPCDRKGAGWGEPVRLPGAINSSSSTFAPAIVRDGSLYFMHPGADAKHFHLYRAQWKAGAYQAPVAVAFNDPAGSDVDPAVAPDESYAVFGSSRGGDMDLYLVKRDAKGVWGKPVWLDVSAKGSDAEARLSPDGQTLYFASDRVTSVTYPRTRDQGARDLARQSWDNSLYNIWEADLMPYLK